MHQQQCTPLPNRKKECSDQIFFQGNIVTLFWKDKTHKPFKVGFDIAKMAGLHESDSRIALRTFAQFETVKPYKSVKLLINISFNYMFVEIRFTYFFSEDATNSR